MKTVTYSLRLDEATYKRVQQESEMRGKKVSDQFRELIDLGLGALPDWDNTVLAAEAWDLIGPAPRIMNGN